MPSEIIGYFLAVFVGISLGMIGSGGSILTVPILVYLFAVEPVVAMGYSLFVVGATALIGGIRNALAKLVDFRTVLVFGTPSIIAVYSVRAFLVPIIPDTLFTIGAFEVSKAKGLMLLFALVMLLAAISMIKKSTDTQSTSSYKRKSFNYPVIFIQGILEGTLTGLVGAGGGFLIVPALVLLARMPMKLAVGTSLFIVSIKSLLGFTGDLQRNAQIDWSLLSLFILLAITGLFLGIFFSRKISSVKLKSGFGWFVLAMSLYVLTRELFL